MLNTRSIARQMKSVGFIVAVLTLWLLAGCGGGGSGGGGGGQQEGGEEQQALISGEFGGVIPGEEGLTDTFLALIVEGPQEEDQEEGDTWEVRAYLCDGKSLTKGLT